MRAGSFACARGSFGCHLLRVRMCGMLVSLQVFACYEMWTKLPVRRLTAAPVIVYAVYKSLGDVWNKVSAQKPSMPPRSSYGDVIENLRTLAVSGLLPLRVARDFDNFAWSGDLCVASARLLNVRHCSGSYSGPWSLAALLASASPSTRYVPIQRKNVVIGRPDLLSIL